MREMDRRWRSTGAVAEGLEGEELLLGVARGLVEVGRPPIAELGSSPASKSRLTTAPPLVRRMAANPRP